MVFTDYAVVLRQPGQFAPGGGGPTQRSWRCGPCERESELEAYGYAQGPEAGGAATAMEEASGASTTKSIAIGVGTGLAVWAITQFLNRYVLKGGKR